MIILLEYNPNTNQNPLDDINNIFSSDTIDIDAEILESNLINENKLKNNYLVFNVE